MDSKLAFIEKSPSSAQREGFGNGYITKKKGGEQCPEEMEQALPVEGDQAAGGANVDWDREAVG